MAAKICVYCGSKVGKVGVDSTYVQDAIALGKAIAQRGFGLVYGGGNVGLMGQVADAVMAAGEEVVGVIPRALEERELAHQDLSELIVVEDMHERKAIMAQRSVAFVALPGGYGTLEELFEVTAWAQLGFHPINSNTNLKIICLKTLKYLLLGTILKRPITSQLFSVASATWFTSIH